jgi:hypothetical protein
VSLLGAGATVTVRRVWVVWPRSSGDTASVPNPCAKVRILPGCKMARAPSALLRYSTTPWLWYLQDAFLDATPIAERHRLRGSGDGSRGTAV